MYLLRAVDGPRNTKLSITAPFIYFTSSIVPFLSFWLDAMLVVWFARRRPYQLPLKNYLIRLELTYLTREKWHHQRQGGKSFILIRCRWIFNKHMKIIYQSTFLASDEKASDEKASDLICYVKNLKE